MKNKPALFLASLIFSSVFSAPVFASVTINSDFKGTLAVTGPHGEVQLIQEGETVPEILSGSTIDVKDAVFTLSTGEGDSVGVSCLGAVSSIGGGSSAQVSCSELTGQITLNLTAPSANNLPSTAAGENLNGATPGGNLANAGPVDSRSIETSPSL